MDIMLSTGENFYDQCEHTLIVLMLLNVFFLMLLMLLKCSFAFVTWHAVFDVSRFGFTLSCWVTAMSTVSLYPCTSVLENYL